MSERNYKFYVPRFVNSRFFIGFVIILLIIWAIIEGLAKFGWLSDDRLKTFVSVLFSSTGSLLLIWFNEWKQNESENDLVDKANFEKFLSLLPPSGAIKYFRDHSFRSGFPTKILDDYRSFNDYYDLPSHKFLNDELQTEFNLVLVAVKEARTTIGQYTEYLGNHHSGFPKGLSFYNESLINERSALMDRETNKAWDVYESFVNKWSRRLKVTHQ